MPRPTTTDLNQFFRTRRNQYQKKTIQRLWRTNPFRSLIPLRPKTDKDGENPTVITHTGELPVRHPWDVSSHEGNIPGHADHLKVGMEPKNAAGYVGPSSSIESVAGGPATPGSPEDVGNQTLSDDNQNPYPKPHRIRRGQIERTFEIRQASFDTDTIDVDSLKRAHDVSDAANAFQKSLMEFMTVFWGDIYRVNNIKMSGVQFAPTSPTAYELQEDVSSQDFAGLHAGAGAQVLPVQLEWEHLDALYDYLILQGIAQEMAIGKTDGGQPVLPIILGPQTKRRLWREESTIAEQVKYYNPRSNLAAYGVSGAIRGWQPFVDLHPIRFGTSTAGVGAGDEPGLVADAIYPTVNAAATFGRKSVPNVLYRDLSGANGACYEVATVMPQNVYEMLYEPSSPTAFAGMKFDPQNYVGEFRWINNPTFEGNNDRGNLGYYLADVRVGPKPEIPEIGVSILHKIGSQSDS